MKKPLRLLQLSDVDKIKTIRETEQIDMFSARKRVWKERAHEALARARTVEDLRDLLRDLIDNV